MASPTCSQPKRPCLGRAQGLLRVHAEIRLRAGYNQHLEMELRQFDLGEYPLHGGALCVVLQDAALSIHAQVTALSPDGLQLTLSIPTGTAAAPTLTPANAYANITNAAVSTDNEPQINLLVNSPTVGYPQNMSGVTQKVGRFRCRVDC